MRPWSCDAGADRAGRKLNREDRVTVSFLVLRQLNTFVARVVAKLSFELIVVSNNGVGRFWPGLWGRMYELKYGKKLFAIVLEKFAC